MWLVKKTNTQLTVAILFHRAAVCSPSPLSPLADCSLTLLKPRPESLNRLGTMHPTLRIGCDLVFSQAFLFQALVPLLASGLGSIF